VPNHSSDEHPWFIKSVQRKEPYTNYYVWKDPIIDPVSGNRTPPNNWVSNENLFDNNSSAGNRNPCQKKKSCFIEYR